MEENMPVQGQTSTPSSQKWAIFLVLAILIVGTFLVFSRDARRDKDNMMKGQSEIMQKQEMMAGDGLQAVKEFNLSSKPFEFSIKEIRVKQGDKVRINLVVEQGMHDWVVDEFNARTKQIRTGESDSVEFIADKTGIFEYYCSVGTHRQMGMVGRLIVE